MGDEALGVIASSTMTVRAVFGCDLWNPRSSCADGQPGAYRRTCEGGRGEGRRVTPSSHRGCPHISMSSITSSSGPRAQTKRSAGSPGPMAISCGSESSSTPAVAQPGDRAVELGQEQRGAPHPERVRRAACPRAHRRPLEPAEHQPHLPAAGWVEHHLGHRDRSVDAEVRAVVGCAGEPRELAEAERPVEVDGTFEVAARHADERQARRTALDELDRDAVGVAHEHQPHTAPIGQLVHVGVTPDDTTARRHTLDRGIEIGNGEPDALEPRLEQRAAARRPPVPAPATRGDRSRRRRTRSRRPGSTRPTAPGRGRRPRRAAPRSAWCARLRSARTRRRRSPENAPDPNS